MKTIELAASLIRMFEGLQLNAYYDKHGAVWTIGFGHTKGVKQGDTVSLAQAEAFLKEDCAPLVAMVAGKHPVEAAALISFGYNCGAGALKRVLSGEIQAQNGEFVVVKTHEAYGASAGGTPLPGLVIRRRMEALLVELSSNEAVAE